MVLAPDAIMVEAANSDDPAFRIAAALIHSAALYHDCKFRHKKNFNPMLGETYEFVTSEYRFFSEQVSHHPPISAYKLEGRGYQMQGHTDAKSKFKIGNGTGNLVVE